MSIERTYYCEGPAEPGSDDDRCLTHVTTATQPPHLPSGFIETREVESGEETRHHFCSWDCLMKFAANKPIPTVIPFDGFSDPESHS